MALLHSCSEDRLADEGLLRALMDAKQAGKIRAFGYSGDGAGLVAAVRSGAFDVVECSVSCLDRSGLDAVRGAGLGVIAKRALANAPWRGNPDGRDDIAEYVRRYDALFGSAPMTFADDELFLRFASFLPEVHCTLVGTTPRRRHRPRRRARREGPSARRRHRRAPGTLCPVRACVPRRRVSSRRGFAARGAAV